MTPTQISLVEDTIAVVDVDALASDFYARAFAAEASLTTMFTTDPVVQRQRFAAELAEIVRSIRTLDAFAARARSLGVRHHSYGVRAHHYALMRSALMDALAAALGERWTDEVSQAWSLAYNLTAETMMLGATLDASS